MIDGEMYKSFPDNINQIADKIEPQYKVLKEDLNIPKGVILMRKLPDKAKDMWSSLRNIQVFR